jgi:voltage-gated potassium channel
MAGFTWITSAVGFTMAEDVGDGRRIQSFFDALWWSAATVTTVGYGDIYPVTAVGRVIAVFTMVVGISTLAVVTARIAQFLISADKT